MKFMIFVKSNPALEKAVDEMPKPFAQDKKAARS